MRVRIQDTPGDLLAAAASFLEADPLSTNVIAVMAARIEAGTQPDNANYLWATVEDAGGSVVGMAMHTPPYPLFLSRMAPEAASAVADALATAGRMLAGVSGASGSTAAFAAAWLARTGQDSVVVTAMRMYLLGQLTVPAAVPGSSALAVPPCDVDLIAEWLRAFHAEATPHGPVQDWTSFAEQRLAAGQIHLWSDGGMPVALAGVSAPAVGVARIGPVYTPPRFRRQGFGAAVTAAASAAACLSGATHVVLYTDRANPISNSIYQAIGYRPDHDAEERAFR